MPTLFLVGELPANEMQQSVDPGKIHLRESSASRMTTRQYLQSSAWSATLEQIRPGDFVIIDFLGSPLPEADRNDATRTLQGFGDGTFDYLDRTTNRIELVHSYGWYLRKMVVEVINHGGVPLLCAGPAHPKNPGAGDWARYIAMEQRVPLVTVAEDGTGLAPGLRALQNDPLKPYLKQP